MGAYFYQDWPEEYGSIWAALDDFLHEPHAIEVVAQIELLLPLSEDGLARATRHLGADYNPARDGMTYRGWLEEVARRVTAALGSPPAP